jgi:hypothetical protein
MLKILVGIELLWESTWEGRGQLDFLGMFWVPNVFNSTFQSAPQVPYVFLNMFPIATHFVPYALLNVGLLQSI